jgi:hypothetical protein
MGGDHLWEAIGAIAELVAAFGVIGSLIYLAKQINANSDNIAQNTKALVSPRSAIVAGALGGLGR